MLRLNVSQWAAQSLTRRNCPTSYTFHVSGHKSLSIDGELVELFNAVVLLVLSATRGISLLQVTGEFYSMLKVEKDEERF